MGSAGRASHTGAGRCPASSPRRAHSAASPAGPDEAELAIAFYNEQADKHRPRYQRCPELTPSIRKRLEPRLKEIRGLENFKRAVLAVQHDAWMAGRKPGRNGKFKLDIEYLLSTKNRDVLVHLLGLADDEVATDQSADEAQAKRDAMMQDIERQREIDAERERREMEEGH